jgi:hypothetical protein
VLATSRPTPLGALARGLAAGVVGTAAMTGWQELSAHLQSSGESAEESSPEPTDPWEQAPAPAKVARRLIKGLFEKDIPVQRIALTTNVMHWAYGTGWGACYGLLAGTRGRSSLRDGVVFGTGVWASSYLELVPMGLYAPPWTYPPQQLALDWSYHLAYGLGTGIAYSLIAGRGTA